MELLTLDHTFERSVHSQHGEDGVLQAIFDALGVTNGTAVEFGAWDGVHLSNTAALRDAGWQTCLIEGDPERYATLVQRFGSDPRVVPVNTWVRHEGESSLDAILAKHFPKPVDLLSIDIDGDDYHILAGLKLRPRVIVVEINPTIPPFIDRVNPLGANKGSSLAAFARLAKSKWYDLVHATVLNAFFVDTTRNGRIRPRTPFDVFRWDFVKFVVSDYDGDNWFGNVEGPTPQLVNPWDSLPAAMAVTYPSELLGFEDGTAEARKRFILERMGKPPG